MNEYSIKSFVILIKQAAIRMIIMAMLFGLFSGCSTEEIPESTETSSENSAQETTSVPNGTDKGEKTIDEGMDIPFYYMIFWVDDMYDFDTEDIGTGVPFYLRVFQDAEGLQYSRAFNKTIVKTGYQKTSRISDLMADRYTEEFFETHDLIIYYIQEAYETYHDVVALRNTDRGSEMTLRNYDSGGPEWSPLYITLIEVPKGCIKNYPAVFYEYVGEDDPLYKKLSDEIEEANRHHFPGGVMEDVHDWAPMA